MFEKLFPRFMDTIKSKLTKKYCISCGKDEKECQKVTDCSTKSIYQEIHKKYVNSHVFGEEIVQDEDEEFVEPLPTEEEIKEEKILALREYYRDKHVFPDKDIIDDLSINARGVFGRTKLHLAILEEKEEDVRDLLNLGVDPKVVDNNGHTPYMLAKIEGKEKMLKVLEELGVKS